MSLSIYRYIHIYRDIYSISISICNIHMYIYTYVYHIYIYDNMIFGCISQQKIDPQFMVIRQEETWGTLCWNKRWFLHHTK